jgi:UDP-3-O-[3-hydroxymyristoyl] N-acetylglucosamine deacetylase
VLDVIGDLALAGLPLLGAYRSVRGGHKLNHAVLTALLADRTAWRVVEGEAVRRTTRPVAETGRSIVGGRIAAAYGPDVS